MRVRHNARSLIVLVTMLLSSGAVAEDLRVRPDDTITPGKVWSTELAEVCSEQAGPNETCEPGHHCEAVGTYSKRHRHTTAVEKRQAYDAYGVDRTGRDFEVDHRVPLCLGGADVAENRWPQLGFEHPSYYDKDQLEVEVCRMVCRERSISLPDGQAIFLGDWIAGYEQIFGQSPE